MPSSASGLRRTCRRTYRRQLASSTVRRPAPAAPACGLPSDRGRLGISPLYSACLVLGRVVVDLTDVSCSLFYMACCMHDSHCLADENKGRDFEFASVHQLAHQPVSSKHGVRLLRLRGRRLGKRQELERPGRHGGCGWVPGRRGVAQGRRVCYHLQRQGAGRCMSFPLWRADSAAESRMQC